MGRRLGIRIWTLSLILLSCVFFAERAECLQKHSTGANHNPFVVARPSPTVLGLRGGRKKSSLADTLRDKLQLLLQSCRGAVSRLGDALLRKSRKAYRGSPRPSKKTTRATTAKPSNKATKVTKATKDKQPSKSFTSGAGGTSLNRIYREIQSFTANPPQNLELHVDPKNIRSWVVTITGAEGTVYAGEKYRLQMNFPKDYPSKPPSVYFLKPVPKHVHVYSNGDICLNLLGKDWSPMLTAEALALSVLSMLSSAKGKSSPPDNTLLADNSPGRQQDGWMYHDDRC